MPDRAERMRQPWWRYLRFSLRVLMILVLAIGVGLSWLVHSARVQRDAVAAIRRAEGGVCYNWEWKDGQVISGGAPTCPRWLVDRLGVDYFGHVVRVTSSFDPSDTELVSIGRLSGLVELALIRASLANERFGSLNGLHSLKALRLDFCRVNDAGLAQLKRLSSLRELRLAGCECDITDAGLVNIKELTGLRKLTLSTCGITDSGLANLAGLTGLRELGLSDCNITDSGLPYLKKLPNLRLLTLTLPDLTCVGVATLKGLASLKKLNLTLREPTNGGLENLKELTTLNGLRLRSIKANDARLVHLKVLTCLRFLTVPRGEITDARVKELEQALPKTKVLALWPPRSGPALTKPLLREGLPAGSLGSGCNRDILR